MRIAVTVLILFAVLRLSGTEIVEVAAMSGLKVSNAPTAHAEYKYLREPNAVVTAKGTLLVAFGPHHKKGRNDRAHQDILLRRSTDSGRTWSGITRIADHGMDSVLPTALVYDVERNLTLLVYNVIYNGPDRQKNLPSRQFVIHSDDEGASWSKPREILKRVGNICVFGGGNGFQIRSGPHRGRLIIPGGTARGGWFLSDDHGTTWNYRKIPNRGRREATGCELSGGELIIYHRNSRGFGILESRSTDNGRSWSAQRVVLPDLWGQCNNSALTIKHRGEELLVIAGPVGPDKADKFTLVDDARRLKRGKEDSSQAARSNGAIFISRDGGRTFPHRALIASGWTFGYNALVQLPGGQIGVIFEGSRGVRAWQRAKRDHNTGAQLGIYLAIVNPDEIIKTHRK